MLFNPKPTPPQSAFRVELVSTNTATTTELGLTTCSREPILDLCKTLVDRGHDPATQLAVFSGSKLVVTVTDISAPPRLVWVLRNGRLRKPVVRVLPDDDSALYRIEWPDTGISPPANLSRCKAAALDWAQQKAATGHRNFSMAQRLKLQTNFWWSPSYVRQNEPAARAMAPPTKTHQRAPELGSLARAD
jgi:hypothetical protein